MKKLMALCLSLLMALSMVSFSVIAEETEAVAFADIANGQLQNFIVKDLVIPEGATVTSSDESIIALDGTVNRLLFDKANVTVTVNGTSFDLTVQPQTIVGVSELVDFDSYGLEDGTALTQDLGWKVGTDSSGTYAAAVGEEDDGNQYGKLSFTSTADGSSYNTSAITYTFTNAPGIQNARYYYLNAKVHVPAKATSHSAINMNLSWGGVKAGEFMLGSAGNAGYIYGGALLTGNPWHTRATAKNSCYKVPTTDFIDLVIKIDKATGVVNYYQNGRWTETVTYDASKTHVPDFTSDKAVKVVFPWRATTSEIWVDDIYVYAEASADDFMGTLPEAERVAYFKSQILASNITSSGRLVGVDSNLSLYNIPAAANTTVTWQSSNTNLITNDGVVTLVDSNTPADVTFTGTITAGDVTDTVVYKLQVAQANTTSVARADLESSTGAAYETEEGRGTVLHLHSENTSTTTKSASVASGEANWFARYLIAADVKYVHNRELTSNYGGLLVNGIQGAESCSVFLNYKSKQIGLYTAMSKPNGTGSKIDFATAGSIWLPMPEELWDTEGEWVKVVIDFNILSQTYDAYVNGIKINETPVVRANAYKTNTSGATIRGVLVATSAAGDVYLDNVTIRKFGSEDEAVVNAALNAAVVNVAGSNVQPVIVNGADLPAKTISRSWRVYNETSREYSFVNDTSDRVNNPGEYTFQEDGPAITYAINGTSVTEINVADPQVVDFTITATSGDISESVTLKKPVAPVGVRGFGLGTLECINAVWLVGEFDGDEKLVAGIYTRNQLTGVKVMPISLDNAKYDETLNMMTEVSIQNTKYSNPTLIKFFILDSDGITPLSVANEDIHD